jgi:hypothetical protein
MAPPDNPLFRLFRNQHICDGNKDFCISAMRSALLAKGQTAARQHDKAHT